MNPQVRGLEETILVVDDDTAVRQLMCRILETEGYLVLQACDGEEALRTARAHDDAIHLLITDVCMPGMGGRDLAQRMRSGYPGLKVLFVSGYITDEVLQESVRCHQIEFLQKPFSPVAMVRRVQAVLGA